MLAGPLALRDGMLIRIGDQELKVERRRDSAEAGRTMVVRPGASLVVGAVGAGAGVAGQATPTTSEAPGRATDGAASLGAVAPALDLQLLEPIGSRSRGGGARAAGQHRAR